MRTIKANKTQFYELLKKYCPYTLPRIENTAYEKANRADAYWLRFSNPEGQWVIAYLEMFCNRPTMRISCRLDHYDKMSRTWLERYPGAREENTYGQFVGRITVESTVVEEQKRMQKNMQQKNAENSENRDTYSHEKRQ